MVDFDEQLGRMLDRHANFLRDKEVALPRHQPLYPKGHNLPSIYRKAAHRKLLSPDSIVKLRNLVNPPPKIDVPASGTLRRHAWTSPNCNRPTPSTRSRSLTGANGAPSKTAPTRSSPAATSSSTSARATTTTSGAAKKPCPGASPRRSSISSPSTCSCTPSSANTAAWPTTSSSSASWPTATTWATAWTSACARIPSGPASTATSAT
jgi:hypothetical protein